jgi:hypothetical protein
MAHAQPQEIAPNVGQNRGTNHKRYYSCDCSTAEKEPPAHRLALCLWIQGGLILICTWIAGQQFARARVAYQDPSLHFAGLRSPRIRGHFDPASRSHHSPGPIPHAPSISAPSNPAPTTVRGGTSSGAPGSWRKQATKFMKPVLDAIAHDFSKGSRSFFVTALVPLAITISAFRCAGSFHFKVVVEPPYQVSLSHNVPGLKLALYCLSLCSAAITARHYFF